MFNVSEFSISDALGNCAGGWLHYRDIRSCLLFSEVTKTSSDAADWCDNKQADLWASTSKDAVEDLKYLYSSSIVPYFQLGFQVRRGSQSAYLPDGTEEDCEICGGLDWSDVDASVTVACLVGTRTEDEVLLAVRPCSESFFFCSKADSECFAKNYYGYSLYRRPGINY